MIGLFKACWKSHEKAREELTILQTYTGTSDAEAIEAQTLFEVWLAIPRKSRPPKDNLLPLRIIYMSGNSWEEGIEENII